MHGEDLLVNDGGNGQAVEAVGKCLPQLDVVASLALIVETVDAVDGGTLVVAAQDEEVLGVLDLVGQEKADGLEGLLATVDVVTEEEVVGLRWESTVLEETEEVVVLAVNVTADLDVRSTSCHIRVCFYSSYLDGCLEVKNDRLGNENLATLSAKVANLSLEELDLLAGAAAADFEETVYDGIEVDIVLVGHFWRCFCGVVRG